MYSIYSDKNNPKTGDMATISRSHLLIEEECNVMKDNGVAIWSPEGDQHHDRTEGNAFGFQPPPSSKSILETKSNQLISRIEANSTKESELVDRGQFQPPDDGDVRYRLNQMEGHIKTLTAAVHQLCGYKSETSSDDRDQGVFQFDDKKPAQIEVQYFLNEGKKEKPVVKLFFKHRSKDRSGKSYFKTYQTLFGRCYDDYGISNLDKISSLMVNQPHAHAITELRRFIKSASRRLDYVGSVIATYFYDKDTKEVMCGLYAVIFMGTDYGALYFEVDGEFVEEIVEFQGPRRKSEKQGSDGIYYVNARRIEEIFDGGYVCSKQIGE